MLIKLQHRNRFLMQQQERRRSRGIALQDILELYLSDSTDDIVVTRSVTPHMLLRLLERLYSSISEITAFKNITFTNYKGNIEDIIEATANEQGSDVERIAFYINELYEAGGYEEDIYIEGVGIGAERSIYGISMTDDGNKYVIERIGSLAGEPVFPYSAPSDNLMPVHRRLKRVVLDENGNVVYYLAHKNSMFTEGNYRQPSIENSDGLIKEIDDAIGDGEVIIHVDEIYTTDEIGKVARIFDGNSNNFLHCVIKDVLEDESGSATTKLVLHHPHHELDIEIDMHYMIGDAKLNGLDGQVMVELPAFYHLHTYDKDNSDIPKDNQFFGTQKHYISLRPFKIGDKEATYFAKRYVSAFEGVQGDTNRIPVDGWTGTFTSTGTNDTWDVSVQSDEVKTILSVAGYYARTSYSLQDFRKSCVDTGEGYHQFDFWSNFIIQLLMIIEFGTMDIQSALAYGIANFNSTYWNNYNGRRTFRRTGDTIQSGNSSWNINTLNVKQRIDGTLYNVKSFSYRGIENHYAHVFKWVDGFFFIMRSGIVDGVDVGLKGFNYYDAYAIELEEDGSVDYTKFVNDLVSNSIPEKYIQLPSLNGESLKIVNITRYWKVSSPHLLPNDDDASETKYCYDYFYESSAAAGRHRVFALGGHADNSSSAGAFSVASHYGGSDTHSRCGGRLCRIGGV